VLQPLCSALGREALTQIGELLKISVQAEGLAGRGACISGTFGSIFLLNCSREDPSTDLQ